MNWRERLEALCQLYYDEEWETLPPVGSSDAMLDTLVAEIETIERVAKAADAWNSMAGDEQECREALIAYRALREQRDAA